ncbi:MAG: GNAT family N-acetyltransferase [Simkaniaceae bacterium]|nr:GNAT family N-acetyltransferase [Simkaniaceae bacterium]
MDLITKSADFDIRYTLLDDEKYLREWLSSKNIYKNFPFNSDEEANDLIKNWIGFSKYKCSLTALFKNVPVGIATLFLMPYRKVAHLSMLYFIVDPKYQRKGVGHSLIKNLKHLAKSYFRLEGLHLDVYENSPALPFLEKQGFTIITKQEKFVKDNDQYLSRYILEYDLRKK